MTTIKFRKGFAEYGVKYGETIYGRRTALTPTVGNIYRFWKELHLRAIETLTKFETG